MNVSARSKMIIVCLVSMLGLIAVAMLGCGTGKPKTPEEAFLKFTHATLRQREKTMALYATRNYIKKLELVFDMLVISSMWPALVEVKDTRMTGDNRAVLKVSGIDRKKETALGVFELKKIEGFWKITNGEWFYMDEFYRSLAELEQDATRLFDEWSQ